MTILCVSHPSKAVTAMPPIEAKTIGTPALCRKNIVYMPIMMISA